MRPKRRSVRIGFTILVPTLALILGAGVALAVASRPSASVVLAPVNLATTTIAANFHGAPSAMAHDPQRNRLWFVVPTEESGTLTEYDVVSGTVSQRSLPDGDYYGVHAQIKLDARGVVWTSSSYTIIRFDPDSGALTAFAINREPKGLMGPKPSAAFLEGSWISAIAPSGDGLLVARNNVAYLERYDSSLRLSGIIPLSLADAGAWDIAVTADGNIALQQSAREGAHLSLYRPAGTRIATIPNQASRITIAGDMVVTSGSTSPAAFVSSKDLSPKISGLNLRFDVLAASATGVLGYDRSQSQLTALVAGREQAHWTLPLVSRLWRGEPGQKGLPARVAPHVDALAVDNGGVIWFFTSDSPGALQRLAP